ncbi:MAG TPA: hypothetical protein VM578_07895 [Candidatus Saccharimonadales bacterium]|nr:hypothetical protein [Candidatus Saccharimonadales bacterium]
MKHLGDEQLAQWLAGEADPETLAHLHTCGECRTEAETMRNGISRYTLAIRRESALAQRARMATNFTTRKALAFHRLRWAGAGVLALALAAPTAWMLSSRPPAISYRTAASAPSTGANTPQPNTLTSPTTQPAPVQSAAAISDDQLLEEVNNDLNREIPRALAPVSVITTARNEIAAARLDTAKPGNFSDLQGESK